MAAETAGVAVTKPTDVGFKRELGLIGATWASETSIIGSAGALARIAYGLSAFTPIGLARRAEVSPGFSFNAAILLGGAAVLALLLAGRAAITALRVVRIRTGELNEDAV